MYKTDSPPLGIHPYPLKPGDVKTYVVPEWPSRRAFFGFSAAGILFAAAAPKAFCASDFWNKKDPDSWSGDEVRQLLSRSPWAKTVRVDLLAANPDRYSNSEKGPMTLPGGAPGGPTVDSPIGAGAPGRGYGPGMERNSRGTEIPVDATTVTVRWESAAPMRAAARVPLPVEMADRYVIGVTSFPMLGRKDDMVDKLRSSATLEAKGKAPEQPGAIALSKDGSEVLFGFSREFLTIAASDRDLTFSLNTGQASLRARFDPKEMVYRGQFAI